MSSILPPPSAPPAGRPTGSQEPTPISPLLPVVLTLVIAAIILSVTFARFFPAASPAAQPVPVARFTNVTEESGIHFVHHAATLESPTTLGGSVAVIDYDHDGHPDLFFVNGTAWPWEDRGAWTSASACALYHNDGTGHFTNVSQAAGVDLIIQGMSAAVGDYDNDGYPDIFITCVGSNHLLHNKGDGTFEDVTLEAGVGGDEQTWSTGATWIDYDGDGLLDLVVAHYARWPQEVPLAMAFTIADIGRSYGAPTGFVSAFPSVYRNLGHGKFMLVAGSAGLRNVDVQTGRPVEKALAVVPVDTNGDGKLDLLFSYHTAENALFLNQGDGTFKKWTGGSDNRNEGASAGLASTSLPPFTNSLDSNERLWALQFASGTAPAALDAAESQLHLAEKFGVALFDYEFNGHLALFSGNGHAEPDVNKFEQGRNFFARPELLVERNHRWLPATVPEGSTWTLPVVARGIALADIDGDGDDDVIIAQNNGPAIVLRNDQRSGQPWLRLHLIATRSQPDAGGARVEIRTPRRIFTRTVAPAMGFMAQSDSDLTFGLGEDTRIQQIVIQWPSGQRQELRPTAIDQTITIREP
ncbi:MAG TPA: CRTAC1 family protein [Lacunisphaera sp.]